MACLCVSHGFPNSQQSEPAASSNVVIANTTMRLNQFSESIGQLTVPSTVPAGKMLAPCGKKPLL